MMETTYKSDEVLKYAFVVSDINASDISMFEFKLKIPHRSLAPEILKAKAALLQVNISRPISGLFLLR